MLIKMPANFINPCCVYDLLSGQKIKFLNRDEQRNNDREIQEIFHILECS